MKADFDAGWRELSEEILSAMREWRFGHPCATFSEIETALDEQLDRQRAQMLEDLALASEMADLSLIAPEERPKCPECGRALGPRGKQERHLQTEGDQQITLKRSYGVCPTCKASLVREGSWMPFERALESLADMLRVHISEATARRETENWGAAYVDVQEEEVRRIEQELPPAPAGPDKMLMSVDGAFVPLVGKEWAEVKTLALGVIDEPVWEDNEWKVHASELSYFSRLMEAEDFGRAALGETHHRGLETAAQVVAVTDGAVWEQGFIDYHREDAARVLDFPHAAEYVAEMGKAVWGEGTETTKEWLSEQLHKLKHEGPTDVLVELRSLAQDHPEQPELSESLSYLEKREAHMQYPTYLAQGWPIGSGAVESANKLVVEARLKGAGMHWARANVNPMLALRNAVCSGRWAQARTQILAHQQLQRKRTRHLRRVQQLAEQASTLTSAETRSSAHPVKCATKTSMPQPHLPLNTRPPAPSDSPAPRKPWRPGPDHPWRHSPIGKARYRKRSHPRPAKK